MIALLIAASVAGALHLGPATSTALDGNQPHVDKMARGSPWRPDQMPWVIQPGPPNAMSFRVVEPSGPVVTIHPDGTIEFGKGYTPEGAALVFWREVARMNRRCGDAPQK